VGAALATDAAGVVHAAGGTGLVSTFTPRQSSASRLFGVANAAGGELAGRVAPGELISIYGLHLGPSTPVSATFNTAGFLPTELAGVQVSIRGIPAPLLYVSGTQINAVVPLELLNVASTSLRVTLNGSALPDFRLVIDPVRAPGFSSSRRKHRRRQSGRHHQFANEPSQGRVVRLYLGHWHRFHAGCGRANGHGCSAFMRLPDPQLFAE